MQGALCQHILREEAFATSYARSTIQQVVGDGEDPPEPYRHRNPSHWEVLQASVGGWQR